ncbi:hypothetical protein BCR44DRAFT_1447125 [Catenaria anguillulae PL171]|uniref:Uncharacterized protein n=1 Tax=Catenaria anguillulae PL171 TaxID=765915 RepID=A0A1Y2H5V8_9FUNG|nr:hypothetical protein BCR44DRAFT_1447125 [Catenaria anguillulae PL171]
MSASPISSASMSTSASAPAAFGLRSPPSRMRWPRSRARVISERNQAVRSATMEGEPWGTYPVAQGLRRLTTDQEIGGSNPPGIVFFHFTSSLTHFFDGKTFPIVCVVFLSLTRAKLGGYLSRYA